MWRRASFGIPCVKRGKNMNKVIIAITVAFTLIIGLFIYVDVSVSPKKDTPRITSNFGGEISEFTLNDGTRCIFAKSGYGGGLSCNFRK